LSDRSVGRDAISNENTVSLSEWMGLRLSGVNVDEITGDPLPSDVNLPTILGGTAARHAARACRSFSTASMSTKASSTSSIGTGFHGRRSPV
jgi:hypothetical protein